MDYKYIYFLITGRRPKTFIWGCFNSKSTNKLGEVRWYPSWRQYCYFAKTPTIYNTGCLNDITHFLNKVNYAHKHPDDVKPPVHDQGWASY